VVRDSRFLRVRFQRLKIWHHQRVEWLFGL
jgi:hypothetical protein